MVCTSLRRAGLRVWMVGLAAAASALAAAAPTEPPPARAAPAHRVPDTLAQRLQACTACHGKEGRASSQGYFPRIAGKPAGYLYEQLLNFRDGQRRSATMSVWVQHLSDDYLREIAEHFAALSLPYPPPQATAVPAATLARGERLVQRGDASRGLPACVQCHGADMKGKAPAMPGLLGLPRDYFIGQMGAWQSGQRRATPPDCMGRIAKTLTPDDVEAVAAWLAAQPMTSVDGPSAAAAEAMAAAPAGRLRTATPVSNTPPIACGSGLQ